MTLFKNKFYALIMLLFTAAGAVSSAEFQAVLEPSAVMEGEPFTLQLITQGSNRAELQELPKNFTYLGSSQSTRIVNGDRTNIMGYQFTAPAPGNYKLPPLKVKMGKKVLNTPELTLQVVKDTAAAQGVEELFARAVLGIDRKKVYVGEDIPLFINVYYPQKIRLQLGYPVLDAGKSIFRDFRKVNPENPAFGAVRRNRRIVDEKLLEEVSFPTAFRPLAAGNLTIKGSIPCNILIPENRRSRDPFDDFFGGSMNYRRLARTLSVEIANIEVMALPPRPQDGIFLGLVGEYSLDCQLDRQEVNALEPVSLNIAIKSAAPLETLNTPALALPGCRVYPADVRYTDSGATVSYVIIPLNAGTLEVKKSFYYFDPARGQYVPVSVNTQLKVNPAVGKSTVAAAPAAPAAVPEVENIAPGESKSVPRSTLLYCKKAPESAFMQFFRRNRSALSWGLFIGGPLVWLLVSLVKKAFDRRRRGKSARSEKAAARRSELSAKIAAAPADELIKLTSGEVADYLADRWQLPPGATLDDLADAAKDAELAATLRECSQASYLPGHLAKTAIGESEKLRKVLLNALKCMVLFGSFGAFALSAAETAPVKDWQTALQAYDRGDYSAGRKFFEQYAQDNPDDPNVLYNLGCFAEASGDQEAALYLMECAGLTAPLDSAIHENRNVMRRKFFWREVGKAESPAELAVSLRDRLHPETYILLAAAVWFIFFVLMIFRKQLSRNCFWTLSIVCGVIFALSLIAAAAQYSSTYSPDQALVVTGNAELYTFPGVHNGKKTGLLAGGTPVKVLDEQSGYALVSSRDQEGWTPQKNIRKLLNH